MSATAFQSATELAAMIRKGQTTSVELLKMYLARVKKYNPDINAIVVLDEERALATAEAADQAMAKGQISGPLHGVPMTIKESFGVAGTPTTFGFPFFKDNHSTQDALAVERMKAAGAVLFGKTNVPLALADFQTYNEIYGVTNNPWQSDRTPGGSSGGSAAALAAGLTGIDVGSDIGGSIRNPAHYCGLFGHKPTYDLLPPRGHTPIESMLSSVDIAVIGPLARSAADLETSVNIMAGPDEIMGRGYQLSLPKLSAKSLGDLKVAVWSNDSIAPVSQEVERRVLQVADAIKQANGKAEQARPDFDSARSHRAYQLLLQATMAARQPEDQYKALVDRAKQLDEADQSERAVTLRYQTASVYDYNQANEERTKLRWLWHAFFRQYDAVIAPIMATTAFPHDHRPMGERTLQVDNDERPYFEQVFWAGLASVSCLPATVIPTGRGDQGLPIGVQIIGPEYGDLQTIGIAALLEKEGFGFEAPAAYQD